MVGDGGSREAIVVALEPNEIGPGKWVANRGTVQGPRGLAGGARHGSSSFLLTDLVSGSRVGPGTDIIAQNYSRVKGGREVSSVPARVPLLLGSGNLERDEVGHEVGLEDPADVPPSVGASEDLKLLHVEGFEAGPGLFFWGGRFRGLDGL